MACRRTTRTITAQTYEAFVEAWQALPGDAWTGLGNPTFRNGTYRQTFVQAYQWPAARYRLGFGPFVMAPVGQISF